MAPPAKKLKTDEEEPKADSAATDEAQEEDNQASPKELEKDAVPSKTPIDKPVTFLTQDTTLNVLPSTAGNVLKCLADAGFQHLLAGARASVGVKEGRYMFEVKILELLSTEEKEKNNKGPTPKQLLRVGFATVSSTLFLGETEENICFTSEGMMVHNKQRTTCGAKFNRDCVLGVLLNLDNKSDNFNTISLFKDGVRVSEPQKLPESLQGKVLFPIVTFRNLTLHLNFGPQPIKPLPFKCNMIGRADKAHATISTPHSPPDGKYEVVFPVSLPDQGTFDWLDLFLEKNPHFTELSDRAILDWCEKSGVWRQKGYAIRNCGDKPEGGFGIISLDEFNVRRVLRTIAPMQQRSFVVMEVKGNLVKDERSELASRFASPYFKRVATVLLGEPSKDFKAKVHEELLRVKQEEVNAEFKVKKAAEKQKKEAEKRAREIEKAKRKVLKNKVKMEEARKRKAEREKKMKEIEEKKAKGEEVEELPEEEEEDKEQEEEEEEEEKEEEEPEEDDEPPTAELSDADKKVWFTKHATPDLTEYVLNTNFSKFTLPEKQEGFEEIRYDWAKAPQSKEYLKEWILRKKLTTRIEDIKPSAWFSQKLLEWQKSVQLWQGKVAQYKAAEERKAVEVAKKKAAALQAAANKAEEAEGDASEEKKDETMEAEESEKQEAPEEEKEEEDTVKVDFDAIDVFGAEDVLDVGNGMPLCVNFKAEDWALMALRFELHLMSTSFRKDADDPERTGIHVDHLPFYYQKYFKKTLNPKTYGVDDSAALVGLVEDALLLTRQQVIESQLPEEMETFAVLMKIAEEDRRWRKLRVDMGDEAARRNIQLTPAAAPNSAAGAALQALQAVQSAQSAQPVQNSIGGKPMWQPQKPLISGKATGKGALLQGVSNAFVQSFLQTALMQSSQVGVKATPGKGKQSWKGGGKKGW